MPGLSVGAVGNLDDRVPVRTHKPHLEYEPLTEAADFFRQFHSELECGRRGVWDKGYIARHNIEWLKQKSKKVSLIAVVYAYTEDRNVHISIVMCWTSCFSGMNLSLAMTRVRPIW